MSSTTNPRGQGIPAPTSTTTTAGGENRRDARKRHRVEATLWIIGMLIFMASCVVIHFHPQPYPFELATTQTVQHLGAPSWLLALINFPSFLNDPIPSAVALSVWVVGLLLVALVRRIRKIPAANWVMSAIFLLLTVMSSAGLNVIADDLVARPRPNPRAYHIHLYTQLVPFPTYPSGHTEHDVAYYGFLLYLSFTKPVREWRYHWLLLPFQLYAVYDILAIGYSRIYEGDHWLTDVLGGYLEGALYLFFFIFLYRWATDRLARRREQKAATRAYLNTR
jgi:membrane-associated phospholipid phosphatase